MAETKKAFLETEGLLNPKPERVRHPLFETLAFFDPLDLPQVRYEMLRAARAKTSSVAEACRLFGFSREYFYRVLPVSVCDPPGLALVPSAAHAAADRRTADAHEQPPHPLDLDPQSPQAH